MQETADMNQRGWLHHAISRRPERRAHHDIQDVMSSRQMYISVALRNSAYIP